ncbi:metalloprotease TIKI1-like [Rhinatrema bivittatum]|uniref:metalloprotease TIKI1-like n=1 Tax=Rhinatrema bivittatum TaxID=194408 RepID=UPI001128F943|nr:metalloprotease TIKI1-like [Rhinatrema bivittatum]
MGNNTVIDILRRQGYEVEHTPAGQSMMNNGKIPKTMSTSTSLSSLPAYAYTSQGSKPLLKTHKQQEELLPPLLLPEQIIILEKPDKKYKKRKKQQKKQKLRQFNDLWVRIEESSTFPPPQIRIINGYITIEPRPQGHGRSSHIQTATNNSSLPLLPFSALLLTMTFQTAIHCSESTERN